MLLIRRSLYLVHDACLSTDGVPEYRDREPVDQVDTADVARSLGYIVVMSDGSCTSTGCEYSAGPPICETKSCKLTDVLEGEYRMGVKKKREWLVRQHSNLLLHSGL